MQGRGAPCTRPALRRIPWKHQRLHGLPVILCTDKNEALGLLKHEVDGRPSRRGLPCTASNGRHAWGVGGGWGGGEGAGLAACG